eukprot:GHVL01015421.1.p1 GENE.GHVL01015421.1~~GHVL01015421.1.p1  ORF type:complete len:554 (+),score=79.46 GHVL01015421.1:1994-3655(+)
MSTFEFPSVCCYIKNNFDVENITHKQELRNYLANLVPRVMLNLTIYVECNEESVTNNRFLLFHFIYSHVARLAHKCNNLLLNTNVILTRTTTIANDLPADCRRVFMVNSFGSINISKFDWLYQGIQENSETPADSLYFEFDDCVEDEDPEIRASMPSVVNNPDYDWFTPVDGALFAGTFDHLHSGHKLILSFLSWITNESLIIGVTDGKLLTKKSKSDLIQDVETRMQNVKEFVKLCNPRLEFLVIKILDPVFGSEKFDYDIVAISLDTREGGLKLIDHRKSTNTSIPTLIEFPPVLIDEKKECLSSSLIRSEIFVKELEEIFKESYLEYRGNGQVKYSYYPGRAAYDVKFPWIKYQEYLSRPWRVSNGPRYKLRKIQAFHYLRKVSPVSHDTLQILLFTLIFKDAYFVPPPWDSLTKSQELCKQFFLSNPEIPHNRKCDSTPLYNSVLAMMAYSDGDELSQDKTLREAQTTWNSLSKLRIKEEFKMTKKSGTKEENEMTEKSVTNEENEMTEKSVKNENLVDKIAMTLTIIMMIIKIIMILLYSVISRWLRK